jgi:hypothetical protein
MKAFWALMFLLCTITLFSQEAEVDVTEPQINDDLKAYAGSIDMPIYIVNDNTIIYQDNAQRIYIDADISTFHFPKFQYYRSVAIDKYGVYFKGKLVTTDTIGYRYINEEDGGAVWKTADKVFKNEIEIKDVDAATYRPVVCTSAPYYTDKDFIYYHHKKIEGSDAATVITRSCGNFCYDKNNVYIDGVIAYHKGERLIPVNDRLVKTATVVYDRLTMKALPSIDAATLKMLSSEHYSADKNHVYHDTIMLPIATRNIDKVKVWDQYNSHYATDGKTIYAGTGNIIIGLDAKTFGMIAVGDIFYDKNGVYRWRYDEVSQRSLPKKFPFKYTLPFNAKSITRGRGYRYLIYGNQAIDLTDMSYYGNLTPQQLAQVTDVTDGNIILSKVNGVVSSDKIMFSPMVFKVGNSIYYNGKKTTADAMTFTNLGNFFKDKNHLYYINANGFVKVRGIDIATAKPFNGFIRDKNYIFSGTTKVISADKAELLGIFTGYRKGCGSDTHPGSNFYLFKNNEGYWLAEISNTVVVRPLGSVLSKDWNSAISVLEVR